ncbi:Ig-like domain-containing protein, partial [Aeromonas veronii]|uniref:Ig-like domain-containing protein n=1 Tax=Aeromonas veronii TaxID=654 RepID=UPI0018763775
TITDAVITALQITPANVSVAKGQQQQMTVMATYSDNTSSDITSTVAWAVDSAIATVTPDGLLTGVETGTTTLTATKDGVSSNQATVNVTDAVITALQITPLAVEIRVGQTQQMQATIIYSDQTTDDVTNVATWSRTAPSVISVTHTGSVNGLRAGSSMVSASYDGVTSNAVEINVLNAAVAAPILTYETTFYTVTGRTEDNAYLEYRYDDEDFWRQVDNTKNSIWTYKK